MQTLKELPPAGTEESHGRGGLEIHVMGKLPLALDVLVSLLLAATIILSVAAIGMFFLEACNGQRDVRPLVSAPHR